MSIGRRIGWMYPIFAVLATAVPVSAESPAKIQPVTFWPFERCEDNTTILDAMKSDCNGQLIGARIVDAGYDGRALSFDGIDDAVIIDRSDNLLTGDTWSVSFWFRRFPQSPGGESRLRVMLAVGDAENLSINAVRGESDQLHIRINESQRNFDFPFDMGWHHMVVVRDSDKVSMYVDRKLLGSLDADTVSPAPLRLGHDGTEPHPSRHFNGLLDEMQVFDHALTQAQIAGMYELDPPVVSMPFIAGRFGGELGYDYFRIPSVVTVPTARFTPYSGSGSKARSHGSPTPTSAVWRNRAKHQASHGMKTRSWWSYRRSTGIRSTIRT
jgi:Concanavalin A-like lectin/glucanases superfamily